SVGGRLGREAGMGGARKVPGNRLRLRNPPDSGGSFGVKQGLFPYIVLMGVAARVAGRPVKWVEDRLEHLVASVSATNRVTTLEASVHPPGPRHACGGGPGGELAAPLAPPDPPTLSAAPTNAT